MRIFEKLRLIFGWSQRLREDMELLQGSELFDPHWYRQNYIDLAGYSSDVLRHYILQGAAEGRNPGPSFDTKYYLENNPDVAAAGVNPLVHYVRHGRKEGRRPKGLVFDADFYAAFYPEVRQTGLSPYEHYQRIGKSRFYYPAFDEQWYRAEYADIVDIPTPPRDHFLNEGRHQGRHPAFHSEWYRHEYADVVANGFDPLVHYQQHGRFEGRHAGFDRSFYLEEYRDVAADALDPFEHYNNNGRREGRFPAFNRIWYSHFYKDAGRSYRDAYEHYRKVGRAEMRPLSPRHLMDITKWGHPNTNSLLNAPWTLDGKMPPGNKEFSPRVTVIVPNYNHARFLTERLDSIYNQTYHNFEVILLDDASSDNSVEIMSRYAARYSDRTTCVFNKNNSGGVFHQWKRGLEIAKGELVWIAESDDYSSLDFLSELVGFFRNNGVMLAFCRTDFVVGNPAQRIWTSESYWSEIGFNLGSDPVVVAAHEIVNAAWGVRNLAANVSSMLFRNPGKLPILDDAQWQRLSICGDWLFYLSIMRGGLVGYSSGVTNFYRQHPQNTSIATHDKDLYYEEHEIVAKYLAQLYDVDESTLRRNEDVLYRHWVMKRGTDRRDEFEKLFDIAEILAERSKRKPNIAIAIYALVTGGGEIFPILIANLLFARGFAVTVMNFECETTNPDIRATINPAIPIVELENSAEAERQLAKLGAELVHSHHGWVDITLAMALRPNPKVRHVITSHGLYETLDRRYLQRYEDELSGIDAFVYIADKNLTNFSDEFKRRQRFTKIANTVSLAPLSGLTRRDLGISTKDFVVCLASRAVSDKGWDEAIQAVTEASKVSKRTIRLLLIGDGPEYVRLGRSALPPFVQMLGFQKNVRDYFALADIGLIASRFRGESCPLVLIECLSVGKPVIASDIGEVRTMLTTSEGLAGAVHRLNNWTVDVSALGEIIANLADNSVEYERLRSRVLEASAKFDQDLMINQYVNVYNEVLSNSTPRRKDQIRLSIVLVAYNMAREVPRTIYTMSPDYQHMPASAYEVILIDNGSSCDYDVEALRSICPNLKFLRIDNATQSPVDALNHGISIARGAVIGVCIDAARMASPNLLKTALEACAINPQTVAGALSFHLGSEPQNDSVPKGYNQAVEDQLLETVAWQANGYELFGISAFDPSSRFGFYDCPAEVNALFMSREHWTKCGGFDPAFVSRGGGLANLDIWRRLCEDDSNIITLLLGEGTFHQVHGGVATNSAVDVWPELHKEYVDIRGFDFQVPNRKPYLFGRMNPWIFKFEQRLK